MTPAILGLFRVSLKPRGVERCSIFASSHHHAALLSSFFGCSFSLEDTAQGMHSDIAGLHDPVLAAPSEAAAPEEHALGLLHKHDAPIRPARIALPAQVQRNAPPDPPPLQVSIHGQCGTHVCVS